MKKLLFNILNINTKSSLSWKLLFNILLFSSVFTVFVSAYQLFHDYKRDINLIQNRMNLIEKSYLSHLVNNVWLVNRSQVEIVLKSILNLPDIEYVELNDRTTELSLGMGNKSIQNSLSKEFRLNYTTPEGESFRLGSLVVKATLSNVYNNLKIKLFVILGTQAVKTFFVSLFIFFITYHFIARHLFTIARFANSISFETLNLKLNLNRKRKMNSFDELDQVADAINDMRLRLHNETVERKQTEEKLRINEGKYRYLFETMTQGVVLQNAEGKIFEANNAACKTLGLTMDQMLGKTAYDPRWKLIHEDGSPYHPSEMPSNIALRTGKPVKDTLCGIFVPEKDEYRWITIDSTPQFLDGKSTPSVTMTVFNDITERKRAEETILEREEQYRAVVENTGNYIMRYDRKFKHIYANSSAIEATGLQIEEYIGRDHREMGFPEHLCDLWEKNIELVFNTGKQQIVAFDVEQAEGPISLELQLNPEFAENGKVKSVIGISRDITERKKMEKQLQQSQKMESIGTLAGGIAHDFNNMLGVITGNISYALSNLNKNDELYEVLSDVQESSKQAQNLTRQLLTFSKGGEPIKKVTDINKLISETAVFSIRGATAKCNFELSNDLWTTEIDEGQINQVIGNLLINANQAMPNGGMITIRTENTEIEAESGLPLAAGRYLKIVVEDQGVGISKKHLSNIFEPYFTTKQKGSGLGLATTYSIIKRHGGHITVYSEIDKGTVFNIYLPASSKDVGKIENKKELQHAGHGKILIMDDQESILKMVGRMLNRMGYETVFATDGSQAVEMYKEAQTTKEEFDAVILDLTVPGGMGGLKTIIELLKIDSNVKAIVSSGYSNDPIMSNYEDYGFCGIMPKPYTKNQLADVLKKIFDKDD